MSIVTEPQAWVLIGLFATLMLGGMTMMTTLLTRSMTASINGLRGEMNARFDAIGTRIDHLDRDIAALSRRVWGERSGE